MSRRPPLTFRELVIHRAPGFPLGGPRLSDLGTGIQLVYGPNASGKTTVARALECLLWPETGGASPSGWGRAAAGRLHLEGSFEVEEPGGGAAHYRVELDAGVHSCRRDGEEVAPPEIPPASARDRYSLALVELLRDEGTALAGAIARELAGGFDLQGAREEAGFRPKPSLPRKLTDELKDAAAAVREKQQIQQALQGQEARLRGLAAERDLAREARRRGEFLEKAVEHARARIAGREAEARLEGFPGVLEGLHGDELERFEDLRKRREELDGRQARVRSELDRRAGEIAATRLPPEGLPGELLPTLGEHEDELREVEEALRRVEGEGGEARELAARALADLHPEGDPAGDLATFRQHLAAGGLGAALPPLDGLLRRAGELAADETLFEKARSALGSPPGEGEGDGEVPDPTSLAETARRLGQWLAAAGPLPPWWTALGLVLAAAVPLVQAAFLAREEPWWWLPAALAALVLLAVAGRLGAAGVRRSQLRADFEAKGEELGIPRLPRWRSREVARALARLEKAAAAALEGQLRQEVWQRVGVTEGSLDRERQALTEQRRQTAGDLGLGPDVSTLGLTLLADRLRALLSQEERLRSREVEAEQLRARRRELLDHLGRQLSARGHAPPEDRAQVRGALEDLTRRQEAWKDATREREQLARSLREEIEPGLTRVEDELGSLLGRLDLAADEPPEEIAARLREWLDRLPAWRQARKDLDQATVRREVARQALAEWVPEEAAGLLARDLAELERELEEARERAGELEGLIAGITEIETRVRAAREGHDLEVALARRDGAISELAAAREGDYTAVAGWILTEHLRREAQGGSLPPVLAQARELFSAITRERYELRVRPGIGGSGTGGTSPGWASTGGAGEGPHFEALDRQLDRVQTLDELSTGTRLQLLVSARMAFVEHQERGAALPLILDEALAVADPERAEALIEAVAEIARRGRQVICLTAQPEEVSRWEGVLAAMAARGRAVDHRRIDLGEATRQALGAARPLPPPPPPRPPVPAPAGRNHREYGELLGVPAIDPWARGPGGEIGIGGVHLWHLVPEPEALHTLLAAGFELWGPARALLERGAAEGVVPGGTSLLRRAAAQARALESALGEWRIGRGRPVERGDLTASGAVSDTFIDAVSELTERLGGDGEALLRALAKKEVKGFLTAKREELERYLAAEGHLDPASPLPREEVRLAVLGAAAADLEAGLLTVSDIDRLLDGLFP